MRRLLILVALSFATGGCANLGVGEAACSSALRDTESLTIMHVQAVPDAKYTPCLAELKLGWEENDWFAENGRAGVTILDEDRASFTASVTSSCDVSGAVGVPSGYPDIERYEDVEQQSSVVDIGIVPTTEAALSSARALVGSLGDSVGTRPLEYVVDDELGRSVTSRVADALDASSFVWIVDALGAEEGTVELRSSVSGATGHALTPDEALQRIRGALPGAYYRGTWFFTFDGGCITYEFDAEGALAETIASDAEEVMGFYPAHELRAAAANEGYEIK